MSLFIESIKIFNGRIYNLRRHESRMQRSRVELISSDVSPIKLRKHIYVPTDLRQGLVKCRIVYDEDIQAITYTPHTPKVIRSLKLVYDNSINYHCKYHDRDHINELYVQKGECDDIIIAKDGMLTDSSYSNIALLQNGKWYTPTTCLLKGTRREQLIDQGRLVEREISVDDIGKYESVCLINAMMGLGQLRINSSQIV